MQIVRDLAGYSLGRSDLMRRAMAKKKKDVMAKEREYFVDGMVDENGQVVIDGCVRRGVPRELWDEALAQLPPAADAVRKVVAARLRGRPMTQEDSRKLAAALQRRGFSWNDIRPVLNEWGQEIDET